MFFFFCFLIEFNFLGFHLNLRQVPISVDSDSLLSFCQIIVGRKLNKIQSLQFIEINFS